MRIVFIMDASIEIPPIVPPSPTTPQLAYSSPSRLAAPLAEKELIISEDFASDSDESEPDEYEKCDCLASNAPSDIPYISIYENHMQIKERGYFTQSPFASIVHAEHNTGSVHLVDRYTYTIEVRHGKHEWIVYRRFSDFRALKNKLLLFRATENLAAPMHRLAERREERRLKAHTLRFGRGQLDPDTCSRPADEVELSSASSPSQSTVPNTARSEKKFEHSDTCSQKSSARNRRRNRACKLPRFPLLPDTAISQDRLEQRKEELGKFLSAVLHVPAYRNHNETLEFLAVSRLSFVADLGLKSCEGFIKKSPGGATQFHGIKRFFITRVAPWRKRWLVLKDTYLVYIRPKQQEISEVLLFEKGFTIDACGDKNGWKNRHVVTISNLHRALRIKCSHEWEAEEWSRHLSNAVQSIGSIWMKPHRFGSSYPIRDQSYARWFVDGRSYMEEAASVIDAAKEDIFITDWWLSPEIFLKRPLPPNDSNTCAWRLDLLLKRKAEQGVRVFILLYREVSFALTINSLYTKIKLQALHHNIKVLRHRGAMNWAHHEKLLIIDQSIAFIGGIDLCYGRWDDHQHRLTDMAGMTFESNIQLQQGQENQLAGRLLHGLVNYEKESERQREEEIQNRERKESLANRKMSVMRKESRWEKPTVAEDEREPSPDFEGERNRKMSKGLAFLMERTTRARRPRLKTSDEVNDSDEEGNIQICPEVCPAISATDKWWYGKDYCNFIHKDFLALDNPFEDFIDRTQMPRMPWHDISSVVYGSAARDAARHFIERWNACKIEKCHEKPSYPFLLPKSYDNVEVPKKLKRKAQGCKIQIIRSASLISTGRRDTEDSIYQAYIHAIQNAQHYVYIENQFFVSQIGTGKVVLNGIAQALFDRIVKAHSKKESFRVYVVMPLLPGFEIGNALFTVLHWTYLSISNGPNSLLKNLELTVGDPSQYITFCSLRKFDTMGERLITELIYIHSKLLIVDDRIVIIGSANINDRSQLGDRDSEVGIYAEDSEFDESIMNGNPYKSGKFAGSLRRQLFREHLGLLDPCPTGGPDEHPIKPDHKDKIDITDPASAEFFTLWKEIAQKNTLLFEEVFDCLPNDNIRSKDQLAEYRPGNAECVTDKRHAKERLKGLHGYLVSFPLNFLIESDLTPPLTSPEGVFGRLGGAKVFM